MADQEFRDHDGERDARRNVLIVGLDEFNRGELEAMRGADNYRFHPLMEFDEIGRDSEDGINFATLLGECRRRLAAFPGRIDAVTSFWDFPISELVPMLCAERGLPGPTLTSVLKCNHKYWSRVEQSRVIAEHVPEFRAVDIFDDEAVDALDLAYPFWLKPVRSYASMLGFRIRGRVDLNQAVQQIREELPRLGDPFDGVLERADIPEEMVAVGGQHCLAEAIIGGRQCTLAGWVHRGEVQVYGVVDSIRVANGSSFARYQYPSTLPQSVRRRMIDIGTRFVEHIGYDDAAFNIELFWQRRDNRIHFLEINSRTSQSHADLFRQVDGSPNLQVAVQLALGERPDFVLGAGQHRCAAKFFIRHDRDQVVTRVPTGADVDAVHQRYPSASVVIAVEEGTRLSDLVEQDAYTYVLGLLFLAADSETALMRQHREILEMLPFEFAPAY
jgi:hypothetical protein